MSGYVIVTAEIRDEPLLSEHRKLVGILRTVPGTGNVTTPGCGSRLGKESS